MTRPAVAHAMRGRLRVRYPAAWLEPRRELVESRLRDLAGVRAVASSARTGSVRIEYDPFRLAEDGLLQQLHELTTTIDDGQRTAIAADAAPRLAGGPAPVVNLLGTSAVLSLAIVGGVPGRVMSTALLAAGMPSLVRAGSSVARGRLNGDVLEASTLALLILRGDHLAGALLTWLRALGDWVVARTVVRARRSLRDVIADEDLVWRRDGEARVRVRASRLRPGDVIVVDAGARIPVDGTVVAGEALVDQQTMTGEPFPVERAQGDTVFAGTRVEHGEIAVRVDRVGLDTAVGRIVRAIDAAADEKPELQVFAERLADRDVRQTLGLAAVGALVSRSIDAGLAILVADYGTAARVGIPTAIVTSMRRASGRGILIKGPRVLERLARVDTIAFDKTGTLTTGTPRVAMVRSYRRGFTEDEVLRLAAAVESVGSHPVARAVAREATARGLRAPAAAEASVAIGFGVEAHLGDRRLLVGSRRFMEQRGIALDIAIDDEREAHAVGAAPTFVALDDRLLGMIVLRDELRPEAPAAVKALRERKMRNVIMLSGDHAEPTRLIAQSLGLRHYHGDLSPDDKAALIRSLKQEGRVVAMVGDGVNDALALNAADVGIAVPGGAELATAAADVVLLRGGLGRVVEALDLARGSIGAVRRTLGIAARANLGVVGLASLGLARPTASILLSHGTTVATAAIAAARSDSARA